MSLVFSVLTAIVMPFVAYVLFGGWPAAIVVVGIYFLILLGAVIKGLSGAVAIKQIPRDIGFGKISADHLYEYSRRRLETGVGVRCSSPSPLPSISMQATNVNNSFDHPSDEDDEEILDVDDVAVPEIVRDHGRRFRKPVKYVVNLGNDEYLLFAEDGEWLDGIHLTTHV
ncbi:MAG TPA: hypothetical protein VFX38_03800 [Gammaproteobacteria bacterium]|nr:hypothetical protein [Gammaproteobacteria bacterium]